LNEEDYQGDYLDHIAPEDERDVMLKRLCKAIRLLSSTNEQIETHFEDVLEIVDEVESYYEPDDPRSMGWVGDDGLP